MRGAQLELDLNGLQQAVDRAAEAFRTRRDRPPHFVVTNFAEMELRALAYWSQAQYDAIQFLPRGFDSCPGYK